MRSVEALISGLPSAVRLEDGSDGGVNHSARRWDMKVRIVVPALTVLVRDSVRRDALAELGFGAEKKYTSEGTEYLDCSDDTEKDMTLEELIGVLKKGHLAATIFQDGLISIESA